MGSRPGLVATTGDKAEGQNSGLCQASILVDHNPHAGYFFSLSFTPPTTRG